MKQATHNKAGILRMALFVQHSPDIQAY